MEICIIQQILWVLEAKHACQKLILGPLKKHWYSLESDHRLFIYQKGFGYSFLVSVVFGLSNMGNRSKWRKFHFSFMGQFFQCRMVSLNLWVMQIHKSNFLKVWFIFQVELVVAKIFPWLNSKDKPSRTSETKRVAEYGSYFHLSLSVYQLPKIYIFSCFDLKSSLVYSRQLMSQFY